MLTHNKKINNQNFIQILNLIFYLFVIIYPHGGLNLFDGIPFLNFFETFYILVIFPFTLIYFWKSFKNYNTSLFLLFAILIKFFLIFTSPVGVSLKQYTDEKNFTDNNFVKTYDTFWNKNSSFVQKKNFHNKNEFPIDWRTVTHHIDLKFNNLFWKNNPTQVDENHITKQKYIKTQEDLDKIELIYRVNFFLNTDSQSFFMIDATGCLESEVRIINLQTKKEKVFFCNKAIELTKGEYSIDGKIKFYGKNWSLNYRIKNRSNTNYISAIDKNIIYFKKEYFLSSDTFINFISNTYIFFLILFPLSLLFIKIYKFKLFRVALLYSVISLILFITINFYLYPSFKLNKFDVFGSSSISLLLIIILIFHIIFKQKKWISFFKLNLKYIFFIILAPSILLFFFNKNMDEIYKFSTIVTEDDWHVFEYYSRQIVVDKEWLIAGEPVFFYRPGARYIYAILHVIFGKSIFAIKFIDVWIVIYAGYSLSVILKKFNIPTSNYIFAGILFFIFYFGENIRYLIGKGLSEFYCLFFIILALKITIFLNTTYKKILLLALVASLGIWMREDHFPIYASFIFYDAYKYIKFKNYNFFFILFNYIFLNYKKIFTFFFLIFLGFLSIFFRNFINTGDFGFLHPNMIMMEHKVYWSLSRMLLGSDPQFGSWIPRTYSVFLVTSFIISIFSMYKKNIKFLDNLIFLPICNLVIIFPFLFLVNFAYPPRFIVHYLFFSMIICFIFYHKFLLDNFNKIKT